MRREALRHRNFSYIPLLACQVVKAPLGAGRRFRRARTRPTGPLAAVEAPATLQRESTCVSPAQLACHPMPGSVRSAARWSTIQALRDLRVR